MSCEQSHTFGLPAGSMVIMMDGCGIIEDDEDGKHADQHPLYESLPTEPAPPLPPSNKAKLPRRRRVKMKFDPALQHKWTHSEANHLYDTLEELEKKVEQCLQNQTLVYKLLEKVEELDETFRKFARGSGSKVTGLSKIDFRPVPKAQVQSQANNRLPAVSPKFLASNQSRVVVLTTSYNPDHVKLSMTTSTAPQLPQSSEIPQQSGLDLEPPRDDDVEDDNREEDEQEEVAESHSEYEVVNEEDIEWENNEPDSSAHEVQPEEMENEQQEAPTTESEAPDPEFVSNENSGGDGEGRSLILNDGDIDSKQSEAQGLDYVRKTRHCPICSKVIISTWGLNRHMLAVHSIGKPLECNICNAKFTRRDALQTHQFRAHGKGNPDARKVLKQGKLVTRRVTSKDIQYECHTCTRTFLSEEAMQEHRTLEHAHPERPFRCQICLTDEYLDKDGMQHHVLTVHPIRGASRLGGICPVCGNNSSTKWHLNRHMLSLHGIGVPKTCSICGKEFARKYRLRMHQLREHGTMSDDLDARASQGPFICPVCNKEFKSKSTLVGHLPGCQGLKPFLCDECGQGFSHRSGVRQHKLSFHMKIKNHFCPVCNKGFFDLGHYNRHVITHSEGKRNSRIFTPKVVRRKTKSKAIKSEGLGEAIKSESGGESFPTVIPVHGTQPVEIIEVYIPDGDIASFNIMQTQQ